LEEFRVGLLTRNPKCFSLDNICRQILGFYMVSGSHYIEYLMPFKALRWA
jgi:hypothetical protein